MMFRLLPPPTDSRIQVQNDFNSTLLSWQNPTGGLKRYLILLFLIAWMGGWAMGEKSAISSIAKGDSAVVFLVFWLAGWTVGGIFCVATIFRLAQPARPERILLDQLILSWEPGTDHLDLLSRRRSPLQLFEPARSCRVTKKEIREIKLERDDERQRLTFDYGSKRIEVGKYLEEPEREWLFSVLQSWKSA
jgi:hypothetical protein